MYKIIYMKADFEPWWQFEGWEENIVSTELFSTKEECQYALEEKLKSFRGKYKNERSKDEKYWAFWNANEQCFCEGCDEDLQIYHGIIVEA